MIVGSGENTGSTLEMIHYISLIYKANESGYIVSVDEGAKTFYSSPKNENHVK